MASAIGILDSNVNCLISRTYTTDLLPLDIIIENFKKLILPSSSSPLSSTIVTPVLKDDENGVNYIYIRSNEIILLCITYYDHANCMTLMEFLYKFKEILLNYFKTDELNKDLILDNFNLIYELFDEVMDFGIPQFTDFPILRDFIKLELNEPEISKDQKDISHSQQIEATNSSVNDYINTSILRTTTSNISWRPKGIFYRKNEFFVDIIERLTMNMDSRTNKITKHEIHGSLNIKSYLSGMPILKIGLNKTSFLSKFKFHQCVELSKFHEEQIISFIPPDGKFILGTYSLPIRTPPIIQLTENGYSLKSANEVVLKIAIKTNTKQRTNLTNLRITVPLELEKYDIDIRETPLFKTKVGKVLYKIDQDCIVWEIETLGGEREFTMMALFRTHTEKKVVELGMDPPPKRTAPRLDKLQEGLDEEDIQKKTKNIQFEFTIPDMTWSGLKVDYLKIEEPQLKYPSFPWVRYKTINDEYVYRL